MFIRNLVQKACMGHECGLVPLLTVGLSQLRPQVLSRVCALFAALAAIALASGSALAQDDATVQSPVQADTTTAVCLVHNPSGIADSDAHTAALLVCHRHCAAKASTLESRFMTCRIRPACTVSGSTFSVKRLC